MRTTTLFTHLRNFPSRRLVIALFAVPAILLGLLAMHVLANGGMTEASSPHASSPAHSPEQSMAMAVSSDSQSPAYCGGECGPNHNMLSMICVLALLISVLLLVPPLILTRWQELRRDILALIAKTAALAPPDPPSLHALSISRT